MTRPAFSLLLCPDSKLLRDRIDALLAAHPPGGGGAWQRFVFWSDEGLTASFWEHLTLQGLFATPKALIVRNAQLLPADTLRALSQALQPMAESQKGLASPLIWPLVCLEVNFERGKPKVPAHVQRLALYETAESRGWAEAVPGLSGQNLAVFIRAEADKLGIALRPQELSLLCENLLPDASGISSEMGKLALLADHAGHLPPNLAEHVGQARELGIFELMRLVQQNRNAPAAWKQILEDRLSGENMVFGFTAILLREARILWQSLAGQTPALPPQIAMQKKIAAQGLGFPGIARLWQLALQVDKGIKSGERSPEQAFEMLAGELFLLFGGSRSR